MGVLSGYIFYSMKASYPSENRQNLQALKYHTGKDQELSNIKNERNIAPKIIHVALQDISLDSENKNFIGKKIT